jgi:hypothetical protein
MNGPRRNLFARWFAPDPVYWLPARQRMRGAWPIIAYVLGATVVARFWLGLALWSSLLVMVAVLVAGLFAIEWWARRVGERIPRAVWRRRLAEDTLAAPFWRSVAVQALIFGSAVYVPALLKWEGRGWSYALVMLPVVYGAALLGAYLARNRAANLLGREDGNG